MLSYIPNTTKVKELMKKTRHEGDESTVEFWLWMKALYKDYE